MLNILADNNLIRTQALNVWLKTARMQVVLFAKFTIYEERMGILILNFLYVFLFLISINLVYLCI